MFVLICFVVGTACFAITAKTLVGYTEMKFGYKILISVFLLCGFFAPFIVRIVRRTAFLTNESFFVFSQYMYFWFGFCFLLFSLLIARDLIWYGVYNGAKYFNKPLIAFEPTNPVLLFKANFITFILGLCLAFYALYEGTKMPAMKQIVLQSPKITQAMTIVLLSDLHINDATSADFIEKIVARVNQENPDLIALAGDIVDAVPQAISKQMEALKDLRAKEGVVVVLGNHEFYVGSMAWEKQFHQMGFDVLSNQSKMLHDKNVFVMGIPDIHIFPITPTSLTSIFETLKKGKDAYRIMLSHTPSFINDLKPNKVDLQLSGHTHGGQIFPFHFLAAKQNGFLAGLYAVDEMMLYVSRGTGAWGPQMRLLAPSEITLIKLEPLKGKKIK